MTAREDFKLAIRAGNISEAFLVAMSNAPELSITTKIVSAEGNSAQKDNCLHTHINLIEGKIENEIGEKLTGDRYSEIKQFHIEQVTQGHQTIQHNLISLQKMFQLMSTFQAQQTSEPSSWVDIAANVTREALPVKPESNKLSGNYGNKTPEALTAGKTTSTTETISPQFGLKKEIDTPEPQLPSFDPDEDDGIADDLLSLADLDDELEAEDTSPESDDWSEWLEEETEVKTEVFDLKSLNIRDNTQNWQNWSSPDDSEAPEK